MHESLSNKRSEIAFYSFAIFVAGVVSILAIAGSVYHFSKGNIQAVVFFVFMLIVFLFVMSGFINKLKIVKKKSSSHGFEMHEEVALENKLRGQGLLMPNQTIYGQLISGYYVLPLSVLFVSLLTLIPWDVIYHVDWYQRFSQIMSAVSVNLLKIPNTPNPFPEYSIAFLSFINVIGPLYAGIGFYFGLKHYREIEDKITVISDERLTTPKLFGVMLLLIIMILMHSWSAYYFSGDGIRISDKLYESECWFVGFFTLLWMFTSAYGFMLSATLLILFNRSTRR